MASSQTTNYQLPQWSKSDRIQMSDFNSAMSTIDAALKSAHESVRIVHGSYTGNGSYGSGSKNSLTFNGTPLLVIVSGVGSRQFIASAGSAAARSFDPQGGTDWPVTLSWNGGSLSWFSANTAEIQCNKSGITYHYIAFCVNE